MDIRKAGGVDRFSSLPSEILEHILFFTGVRQAVQLSVLSSTWKNLWKSMPDLYLDARDLPPTGDQNWRLFSLARKVLRLRTETVRKLRIVIFMNRYQSIQISPLRWFNYAQWCHADELTLSSLPYPSSSPISRRRILFADEYTGIVNFGKLRSLTIRGIRDSVNAFEPPSDALPLLEKLSMSHCSFEAINISFSRLKVLTLHYCYALGGNFRVATPNLETFDYRESFFPVCELENQPSLVDASIDISLCNQSGDALLQVFRAIQNATSVNLSWSSLEAYYKQQRSFSCLPTFHNAKHVTLVNNGQRNIMLTKDLMQKWPNVETLTIR
ncbi:putative F-box/FBD/LRR-repeat protein At5g44950 [Phoenix dactylifera]|uniref:F-box/FBD/LRR-repeat protein At5g44950 n=1 Tax=Phoenix dactylifera TaxID=42345 RepID=A0A8B7CQR9_PHODC|nr:putative F-box/FBD/LRR-repeat protein At5g44950 [Phoenix dactylifera]